jgi:hypothetical protein
MDKIAILNYLVALARLVEVRDNTTHRWWWRTKVVAGCTSTSIGERGSDFFVGDAAHGDVVWKELLRRARGGGWPGMEVPGDAPS